MRLQGEVSEGSNFWWKDRVIQPERVINCSADAQVLICTGSSGTVEGNLSAVHSYTVGPSSQQFQQLLVLRRLEGEFGIFPC
jgi:hypothetical protein